MMPLPFQAMPHEKLTTDDEENEAAFLPEEDPEGIPSDESESVVDVEDTGSVLAVAGALVPMRGPGDPLSEYLKQIAQHTLLTPEEEIDLARRYRDTGDRDAAWRMTTANLRLVVKIAFELNRTKMDVLDLIQEGNLGLMRAVQKYDPEKGIRFASYAVWWIKGYIYKYILDNWKMVKIGTTQNQRKLFFSLRKEEERLRRLGFVPTAALIADGMGVRESEVTEMQKRLEGQDLSLDAPLSEDSDLSGMDMLESEEGALDDRLAREEFDEQLHRHLGEFGQTLKGRDLEIFQERMLNEQPLTLQEIGDRMGITRERARQLEARIKKNLRAYLEERMPDIKDVDFALGE